MKQVLSIVFALVALWGMAQENQSLDLHFDPSVVSPQFTRPDMPMTVLPAANLKPVFNARPRQGEALHLDYKSQLPDSLAFYQPDWNLHPIALPTFRYDTDPYSRDWSSSGVITRVGSGYLTGAGSHTTYPGMGNTASASVALTMPMGNRFQVTAGVTGSKYHFDNNAWNDYGVFANATFRVNDRFSLNAFGQHYVDQRYHSVASMPFLGSSSYGGTIGWQASDNFSLDMGARRIYDPYTGTWRTLPVVQPTFNLFGAPISFDAGPLIYQVLDYMLGGKGKNNSKWNDPRYRPVNIPNAVTTQPGFNPNSPVSIPDAFRR